MQIGALNINKNFPAIPAFKAQKQENQTAKNTENPQNPLLSEASKALFAQISAKAPVPYNFLGDYEIKNAGNAKLYKLATGQKVVILNKKGPTVLKSYFNVGSMNEPDNLRGISHFDEHMAFNGAKGLGAGEFFKITNDMGAITNASTGFSMTDYFISSQLLNPGDFEESVRIHAAMLQNPDYKPEMVEKERGPVTSEISMVGDSPENTALNNCIRNLFQIKTTSQDLVAGSIKNINNITRDDAYNYYKTWYTPDNCVTVITGEVEPEKCIQTIAKHFNNPSSTARKERKYEDFNTINAPVRQDVKMRKAQSTTAAIGFAGPKNSEEKEYVALELMLMALLGYKGARLSKELDKMQTGAMFSVERMGNRPEDPRAILFVGQSTPEKAENLIKTMYSEIGALNSKPISEEELSTAKNMLRLGYSNLCENSSLLNSFLGTSLIDNNLNYAKNYLSILESITTADLQDFAKKYLDLSRASLSVVHPESLDNSTIMENYKKSAPVSFKGSIEEKSFDLSKIKQYRLANNMRVTFNPNKSELANYEISLDTRIPAQAKPAAALLLSVMLNEGSRDKNYNELYAQANKNGMDIKFKADFNSVTASVNALSKDMESSLKLVKEVLQAPRLNDTNFEYAKSFVRENVMNSQNSAAEELLKDFFPNSPEFASKEEILKSLDEITLPEIVGLYNYIVANAQATGVFTAPVDANPELKFSAINELSDGFVMFKPVEMKHFESFVPVEEDKIIKKADERNQADIVQAFKFKTNFNPKDHLTIALLNTILGGGAYSRLFNDLRETQKLAYRVESNIDYHGNTGVLSLGIKTTTDNPVENVQEFDNVKKSIDGFKKHINLLKTEKVADDELSAAKLRYKTKILNAIESSEGQTHVLSNSQNTPYSIASTGEALKIIESITPDDIYNAANYIFGGHSVISILASQKTLDNAGV